MRYDLEWYFLSFKGRIRRLEFWLGYAAILVTIGALAPLFVRLFGFTDAAPYDPQKFLLVLTFYVKASTVVSVWPTIAIYAKRLHDLGLSAWWLLVWGLATLIAETVMAAGFVIPLLGFAILGFVPGTVGPNRFGDDPYGNRRV
jgi:uncharacterized membrane protein YhaH (DUF805 family)